MIEVDKEEHDSDTYKRDILDALEELEAKDILDRTILSPLFWGKTDKEVADYLGAPRETIRDRRSRLYKEFLNLTR
jgi:FixJ family two-component response regulator